MKVLSLVVVSLAVYSVHSKCCPGYSFDTECSFRQNRVAGCRFCVGSCSNGDCSWIERKAGFANHRNRAGNRCEGGRFVDVFQHRGTDRNFAPGREQPMVVDHCSECGKECTFPEMSLTSISSKIVHNMDATDKELELVCNCNDEPRNRTWIALDNTAGHILEHLEHGPYVLKGICYEMGGRGVDGEVVIGQGSSLDYIREGAGEWKGTHVLRKHLREQYGCKSSTARRELHPLSKRRRCESFVSGFGAGRVKNVYTGKYVPTKEQFKWLVAGISTRFDHEKEQGFWITLYKKMFGITATVDSFGNRKENRRRLLQRLQGY